MSRQQATKAIRKLSEFNIDEDDEFAIAQEIVASFGNVGRDADAHIRLVRVLHACLSRYVWTWESLGCELPGPLPACEAIQSWLTTGTFIENFAEVCIPVTPIRDGHSVQDCDEPALSDLSNGSARLAYYCKTRNPYDAAIVLVNLFWADAESLQADDGVERVEWLMTTGVHIAWPDEDHS